MIDQKARIGVTHRSIMGSVANWAVQQSPYHRPDNLEIVLDKLHEQIKDDFDDNAKYVKFFESPTEVQRWLGEKLRSIPEFLLWNERKNGRQGMGFSGAGHHDDGSITFFQSKADDDFIDLDALIRNAARGAVY